MNYMKLIKLLYLADRQHCWWQQPITGDKYYSMPWSVVSTILDIISVVKPT